MTKKYEIFQHFRTAIAILQSKKVNWQARLANYNNLKVDLDPNSSILISYVKDNNYYSVIAGGDEIIIKHRFLVKAWPESRTECWQKNEIILVSGIITACISQRATSTSNLNKNVTKFHEEDVETDSTLLKEILSDVADMLCIAAGVPQYIEESVSEPNNSSKKHKQSHEVEVEVEEKTTTALPPATQLLQCSFYKNPLSGFKLTDYETTEIKELAAELNQSEGIIARIYTTNLLKYSLLGLLKNYIQNANNKIYPGISFEDAQTYTNDQAATLNIAYDFIKADAKNKDPLCIETVTRVPTYHYFLGATLDQLPVIKDKIKTDINETLNDAGKNKRPSM